MFLNLGEDGTILFCFEAGLGTPARAQYGVFIGFKLLILTKS